MAEAVADAMFVIALPAGTKIEVGQFGMARVNGMRLSIHTHKNDKEHPAITVFVMTRSQFVCVPL